MVLDAQEGAWTSDPLPYVPNHDGRGKITKERLITCSQIQPGRPKTTSITLHPIVCFSRQEVLDPSSHIPVPSSVLLHLCSQLPFLVWIQQGSQNSKAHIRPTRTYLITPYLRYPLRLPHRLHVFSLHQPRTLTNLRRFHPMAPVLSLSTYCMSFSCAHPSPNAHGRAQRQTRYQRRSRLRFPSVLHARQ